MWINKVIYFVLIIYAAVLALIYSEAQALYIFIILALLPFVFLTQVFVTRRKIQITLTSSSTLAVAGVDDIPLSLYISNKSILPVTCIKMIVEYGNTFSNQKDKQVFMISLGAKKEKKIDFMLQSSHTGLVKVKVAKVKVYDFIRVFSRRCKCEAAVDMPVMPEIFGIENNIIIREPDFVESDTFSKNKPGDDPSEVFDIREYKEGDKIHRIHWKLSSKKDTVLVKDYSLPITNSSIILVNNAFPSHIPNKLAYMDAVLETTAAVSYHLLISDYHHSVGWCDQKEEYYVSNTIENFDDMHYMMCNLIQATPAEEKNNILDLYQVYGGGKQISKLFYITYELTEETIVLLTDCFGVAQIEVLLIGNQEAEEEFYGSRLHKQYISITNSKASIETLQW